MIPADYKISLNDGTAIPLLFNTWTFRHFSRKMGVELEELVSATSGGKAFKANNIPDLLLSSSESFCRHNAKEFNYTDLDGCMWMDALGGFNSSRLVDLFKVFIGKLLNISPEQFDVLWANREENKPEPSKKKNLKAA